MDGYPQDYHLHSMRSIDCDVPMATQCARAAELGIRELCITDHCDWHPLDTGFDYYDPAAYFADLTACRAQFGDQLTVLAGVEIGEPHVFSAQARELVDAWPYDFVLGSLHFVGDLMSLDPEYFEGRSAAEAYPAYFDELQRMVQVGGFDVVGHLDVPKRVGYGRFNGYDARDYEEPIRAVLRACIERGIGIEINTSTLRRGLGQPSPSFETLCWYREMGGEILTLGSDSHHPDALASYFDDALHLARSAGFRYLTHFRQRYPRFEPLP